MVKGLDALNELERLKGLRCLSEKDYDYIVKSLNALEIIRKAYGDYANHKIGEYELIMIVGDNTTC